MPDAGSQVLEVVIGLAFIYLVFSLVCTALVELVSTMFSLRARSLEAGIRSMLLGVKKPPKTGTLLDDLAKHPRIQAMLMPRRVLGSRKTKLPAYLSARTFSLVVLDTIAPPPGTNTAEHGDEAKPEERAEKGAAKPDQRAERENEAPSKDLFERIEDKLDELPKGLQRQLRTSLESVKDDRDKLRAELESWFDDTMNRVSGWYRRRAQLFLVIFGLLVAAVGNVNTIHVVDRLWSEPAVRSAIVAQADDAVASGDTQELEERIDTVKGIRELQLPVGWTFPETQAEADPRAFPESIDFWWFVGVIITGLALSFGAPFWFDAISRLSRLRPTGKPEGRAPGTPNP